MSMGAYGPKTGMPRILDLLDRYGLKTCFFIPGWIVERYPALCEEIVRRGHEVGHHGYLHEKPFFLSGRDEEEALLVKSLDIFKRVLGTKPLGARAPAADPSRHTMDLLKKHGFVYHSNALDTDLPYCHETPHGPLVEFPTAWCNNDAPFFLFSAVRLLAMGSGARKTSGRSGPRSSKACTRRASFNWLGHPRSSAAVTHAHDRAPHPEDPRQERHLVADARRARPVLARAEPGPRSPLMHVQYTAAREELLMKVFAKGWVAALLLILTWAPAAPAQQPVTLAFSTLDTGSAWYVYGATIAELLRKTLPPGSNVDVKPRAGGVGNPRLVARTKHRSGSPSP
jgi:peptidoglycan/xylan/chitin deacetylase (PgdA/CDA1 family)